MIAGKIYPYDEVGDLYVMYFNDGLNKVAYAAYDSNMFDFDHYLSESDISLPYGQVLRRKRNNIQELYLEICELTTEVDRLNKIIDKLLKGNNDGRN